MSETNTLRKIRLWLATAVTNCRLFRNNTGTGWQGQSKQEHGKVIIYDPRPLNAGLCVGSSDLIGWTSIEITPDMVGRRVAVFTAVEVKYNKGRLTKEQFNFIQQVRLAGGIAGMVKDEGEAEKMIKNWLFPVV